MSPDAKPLGFQQQQLAFTAHIRDPAANPVPEGISRRRMSVYTELIFNNLDDQLSANFPILSQITDRAAWIALVRSFLRRHKSQTPLFTELGQEFVAFLRDEHPSPDAYWPFMLELAHYEYVELAVAISPADESQLCLDPNGDLLAGRPVVAPTAWNLTYRWPVHQIGPDYLPSEPSADATHLVVYRDRADEVHFLQINAVTQRLLELLRDDRGHRGLDALKIIAEELCHPDPAVVVEGGVALLDDLRERNVILGTRA